MHRARARFPGISRADFAGIAVLQAPLSSGTNRQHRHQPTYYTNLPTLLQVPLSSGGTATNPLRPCGACSEWLLKLGEHNPS